MGTRSKRPTRKSEPSPRARAAGSRAWQRAETSYRELFDHIADAIFVVDPETHRIIDCNEEACRRYGYTREEFLGMMPEQVHPAEERERVRQRLQQQDTDTAEFIHVTKSGRVFPVEVRTRVIDHEGRRARISLIHDLTPHKLVEKELQESEDRFRAVADNIASAIYIHDGQRMLYVNPACEEISGYSRAELMNRVTFWDMVHPDFREMVQERARARLEGRPVPIHYEFKITIKDGSERWLDFTASRVQFEGRTAILSTAVDITERKQAAELLHVQKAYLEQLFEFTPEAIAILDGEKHALRVNREFTRLFGFTAEEAAGKSLDELVVPPDKLPEAQAINRRFAAGETVSLETVRRRKDGSLVEVSILSTSLPVAEGRVDDYTIYRDISERKKAERLQSALYRIASLASSAADLHEMYGSIHHILAGLMYARNCYIALHDPDGGYTFPYFVDEFDENPGPQKNLRGLTEYVLRTGKPLLATPDILEELVARGEVERRGAPSLDWMGVPLKQGDHTFGVLVLQTYEANVRYGEEEKEILVFVSQQIANAIEHRRNQQALARSEARYRSLVESAVHGIYRSTLAGHFLDVNPALVSMLGYDSAEQVLALDPAADLYVEPGESERVLREYERTRDLKNVEVKWRRRDGSEMTVRLNGRASLNPQGEPEGFEVIAEDVTERRALEEQLRQALKMEAVGRLAGGVAHDFNNLLTVIKGNAELMLDSLDRRDPMHSELEEVQKAAERAAALTRQLLAFSRQQVLTPQVLDLNTVVVNIDKLLRRLLGEDIELHTVLDAELARVKADPGQIEQVIMNLAVNARDAMPRGGKLTIETANIVLDENYARERVEVKPGPYVMLAVSDNGTGMDPETCSRIFEPFFTTKDATRGTGLGLSTVYGIVKQSDGHINVYSEPGMGTSFKVYLPRVAEATAFAPSLPAGVTTDAGSETILLVEDEDGVRGLVRQVLRRKGYSVLEARDGGEALLTCEHFHEPIHLLLTDVVLAHMSGRELAERLLALRPEMKVLYMSGYTDDAIVQHGIRAHETAFLQKPFTTDALARKVREVLDASVLPRR